MNDEAPSAMPVLLCYCPFLIRRETLQGGCRSPHIREACDQLQLPDEASWPVL